MRLYAAKSIATVLDLTERRVRQLRDKGILEERQPGYYELLPAIRAYVRYLRSLTADNSGDYNTEKARFVRARRESQELELAVKRGQLHSAQAVEQVVSEMLTRFKSRILALPGKLSPRLCELTKREEIQLALRTELEDALSELAEFKTVMEAEEASENEAGEEDTGPVLQDI